MAVTIYHNPKCGTSRTVLGMLQERGVELEIIEYLQTPPSVARLGELVAAMGVPVRDVIRAKEAPYAELGLDDPGLSDEALLAAMVAHPILINRPIVVTPKGVRLCRPADEVLALL